MADQITINGELTEVLELSVSLVSGAASPTVTFKVVSGLMVLPAKGDVVELDIDGIVCEGMEVDADPASYEGDQKLLSVTANLQYLLESEVSYQDGPATRTEILTALTAGTGMTGTVVGETEDVYPFSHQGSLKDALDKLLTTVGDSKGYLAPDRTFWLVKTTELMDAPLDWVGDPGYQLTSTGSPSGQSKSKFVCHGRNPKPGGPGGLDFTDYANSEAGDGAKTDFVYDEKVTNVTGVFADDVQVSFVPEGYEGSGAVAAINITSGHLVRFNTAPADGVVIRIEGTIDYATAEIIDETLRDDLIAKFAGTGIRPLIENHPEFLTQDEVETYVAGMALRYGGKKYEASAEVWGKLVDGEWVTVTPYTPRHQVVIDDDHGFSQTLPVQGNNLVREAGQWKQSVTCGNGEPRVGAQPFHGIANRLRRATLPPQPPAPTQTTIYYTEDLDFSLAVTPADRTVDAGTTDPITFTVEATAIGGFAGPITLAATVPTGVLKSFSPAVITPGTPSTLTLTPPEGGWTEAMAGDVTVSGTSTPLSHNADPVAIVVNVCESLTYELRTSNHQVSPDPGDYDGLLCYGSGAPDPPLIFDFTFDWELVRICDTVETTMATGSGGCSYEVVAYPDISPGCTAEVVTDYGTYEVLCEYSPVCP